MSASGERKIVSKRDGEPEPDAPKGLWSDRPPAMPPPRASKSKGTLIGGHAAAPPPPPGKLPVPKIPKGGLPPAPPRPKVELVRPRPKVVEPPPDAPETEEPTASTELEAGPTIITTKQDLGEYERLSSSEFEIVPASNPEVAITGEPSSPTVKRVFEAPAEVDPAVAFKVEPTPVPPALPRPPSIPTEAKRPPVPLDDDAAAGPVREDREPRLLSSMPPPPPDLRNPFEPVAEGGEVAAAAPAPGFEPKSAGVGFLVGALLAGGIAFALWPSAPAPTPLAANATARAEVEDPVPDPVIDEDPVDEAPVDEALDEAPLAEAPLDEAPVAEEPAPEPPPVVEAPAPRPPPVAARPVAAARPRPEPVARAPRPAPEPVAEAPRPRPVEDGPAIAAETTARPARPTGDVPATPSRDDVASAIQAIRPQLRECAPELNGHVANVRFTFVSSGRATSAIVPNDFGSPQQRSCVARVARQASVPPFSDARLVVTYPVQF